jgi:hypothetical protein
MLALAPNPVRGHFRLGWIHPYRLTYRISHSHCLCQVGSSLTFCARCRQDRLKEYRIGKDAL